MAKTKKVATVAPVADKKPAVKNWTAETIMAWQKKTFPKATTLGQIAKFKEEYAEFCEADKKGQTRKAIEELADMFIVACGLLRLSSIVGLKAMNDYTWLLSEVAPTPNRLQSAINRKMEANVARTWRFKDGKYHHI